MLESICLNTLYAEAKADYMDNSVSLSPNLPESDIINGFDWKYDDSFFEYDVDCKDMQFDRIDNG